MALADLSMEHVTLLVRARLNHVQSPRKYVRVDSFSFFLLLISQLQNSFDALELYIQLQKALLARTQSDADRLPLLLEQVATDPGHFFDAFDEKVYYYHLPHTVSLTRTTAQR